MDNPGKNKLAGWWAEIDNFPFSAFAALTTEGRRGVRIFRASSPQLALALTAVTLFAIPLGILIGVMPIWDEIGDSSVWKDLHATIAPGVEKVPGDYRDGQFPLRRFLVSCTVMLELLVVAHIVALLARGVRKHALLVWTCHDRRKLLRYFAISALVFSGFWYVLFSDWPTGVTGTLMMAELAVYCVLMMPVTALVFGHLLAIVVFGAAYTVARSLRRLRRRPQQT